MPRTGTTLLEQVLSSHPEIYGAGELPDIKINYKPGGVEVVNNGHSIQVNYAPGSTMSVSGQTFELKQFHFHSPSENTIDGKSFAMEAHYVHADKNSNPGTGSGIQVNFKNTLTTMSRYLEEILYAPSQYINQVMTEMVCSISRYHHKKREGRHYVRESKQPAHQWNTRRNHA